AVVASVGPHLLLGTHESLSSVYRSGGFFSARLLTRCLSGLGAFSTRRLPHLNPADAAAIRPPTSRACAVDMRLVAAPLGGFRSPPDHLATSASRAIRGTPVGSEAILRIVLSACGD